MSGKSWGPPARSAGGAAEMDWYGVPQAVYSGVDVAPALARAAARIAVPALVGRGQELLSEYAQVGADIISGRLSNSPGTNGMNPSLRGTSPSAARANANLERVIQQRSSAIAQSRLRGTAGMATPITQSMKPAQLIPGRGAELFVNQTNVEAPIKFKTGELSTKRKVDAFAREAALYKSQAVAHAFAFKAILLDPSYIRSGESLPINRFVCHNVFRHNVPETTNVSAVVGSKFGTTDVTWNNSLGPDASQVRKQPPLGTAVSAFPAGTTGLNINLNTPYRYPQNGDVLYSRMNRQTLENLGWNANPIKMRSIEPGAALTPTVTTMEVYDNASLVTTAAGPASSIPNQCPVQTTSTGSDQAGPSFFYRSQMGIGEICYNFINDGLNPICVDVVITRLKKSQEIGGGALVYENAINQMVQSYQKGYMNYATQNQNQANFAGDAPQEVDVTTNARGAFLPAKALGIHYKGTGGTGILNQDAPFKQVARDQFIMAGGGSREWSMKLQAVDYDARRYNQSSMQFDDLTYIISFGISGVPLPYIETGVVSSNTTTAIIDRRGTACNVSVTGMYKEIVHPVYMSRPSAFTYVNGTLDIPGFTSGTATISTADIANLSASTRQTTVGSAIMNVSPFSTIPGA